MIAASHSMLLLQAIDPDAHLRFSPYTGKWFMRSNCDISDGVIVEGVTEHRDDPAHAVLAFVERLKSTDHDHWVRVGGIAADPSAVRAYRWNGAAFAEVPYLTAKYAAVAS